MNPDYTITTDQQRFDLIAIHAFLSQSYWSPGVSMSVVEKALANSVAFGLFHGDAQVGLARVRHRQGHVRVPGRRLCARGASRQGAVEALARSRSGA